MKPQPISAPEDVPNQFLAKYSIPILMGVGVFSTIIFIFYASASSEYAGLPAWSDDWKQAEALSSINDQPRLVVFFGMADRNFQDYEKNVLSDPDLVAKLSKEFLLVKVDARLEDSPGRARAREYRLTISPALMIFYPGGKHSDPYYGPRTSDDILFWVAHAKGK